MKRLKIGIDIDGVLADIVEQMLPLLARECGRAITQEDIVCYEFGSALQIPQERVTALMAEVIAGGHFELAPVVEGAAEVTELLQHHSLWLVTSRPAVVRQETVRWLAKHGVTYHELVFAPAMAKASREDAFDLFVEDYLEAAVALAAEGIPVLLFDRPWNRQADLPANVRRVRTWHEILRAVEEIARA